MLVTVSVVCYNSEQYVLETLESVYNQTYNTLELIISDDASSDNTLQICVDWINQEHVKKRFTSIQLLAVEKNTGVSACCNRIIKAASSDWIKFIAGDDILLPNCIEDNIEFIMQNSSAKVIFSQVKVYQDTFTEKNFRNLQPDIYPNNFMGSDISANKQFKLLLESDRITYTPSYFFNRQALLKVDGYDESNRLVEDYPMWLKLTGSGERLYYFHKLTVGYRIHSKATNNTGDNVIFKPSVFNSFVIRKKFAHPHLPWEIVASEYHVYWVSKFFQQMGWNKRKKISNIAYTISCFYLNPFHYINAVMKRMPFNKHKSF